MGEENTGGGDSSDNANSGKKKKKFKSGVFQKDIDLPGQGKLRYETGPHGGRIIFDQEMGIQEIDERAIEDPDEFARTIDAERDISAISAEDLEQRVDDALDEPEASNRPDDSHIEFFTYQQVLAEKEIALREATAELMNDAGNIALQYLDDNGIDRKNPAFDTLYRQYKSSIILAIKLLADQGITGTHPQYVALLRQHQKSIYERLLAADIDASVEEVDDDSIEEVIEESEDGEEQEKKSEFEDIDLFPFSPEDALEIDAVEMPDPQGDSSQVYSQELAHDETTVVSGPIDSPVVIKDFTGTQKIGVGKADPDFPEPDVPERRVTIRGPAARQIGRIERGQAVEERMQLEQVVESGHQSDRTADGSGVIEVSAKDSIDHQEGKDGRNRIAGSDGKEEIAPHRKFVDGIARERTDEGVHIYVSSPDAGPEVTADDLAKLKWSGITATSRPERRGLREPNGSEMVFINRQPIVTGKDAKPKEEPKMVVVPSNVPVFSARREHNLLPEKKEPISGQESAISREPTKINVQSARREQPLSDVELANQRAYERAMERYERMYTEVLTIARKEEAMGLGYELELVWLNLWEGGSNNPRKQRDFVDSLTKTLLVLALVGEAGAVAANEIADHYSLNELGSMLDVVSGRKGRQVAVSPAREAASEDAASEETASERAEYGRAAHEKIAKKKATKGKAVSERTAMIAGPRETYSSTLEHAVKKAREDAGRSRTAETAPKQTMHAVQKPDVKGYIDMTGKYEEEDLAFGRWIKVDEGEFKGSRVYKGAKYHEIRSLKPIYDSDGNLADIVVRDDFKGNKNMTPDLNRISEETMVVLRVEVEGEERNYALPIGEDGKINADDPDVKWILRKFSYLAGTGAKNRIVWAKVSEKDSGVYFGQSLASLPMPAKSVADSTLPKKDYRIAKLDEGLDDLVDDFVDMQSRQSGSDEPVSFSEFIDNVADAYETGGALRANTLFDGYVEQNQYKIAAALRESQRPLQRFNMNLLDHVDRAVIYDIVKNQDDRVLMKERYNTVRAMLLAEKGIASCSDRSIRRAVQQHQFYLNSLRPHSDALEGLEFELPYIEKERNSFEQQPNLRRAS